MRARTKVTCFILSGLGFGTGFGHEQAMKFGYPGGQASTAFLVVGTFAYWIAVSPGLQHLTCRGVSYHDATEAGAGANGVRFGGDDLVRTTSADGSFDERGFLSGADVHTLHVGADFAASLHVERPGANLRDVSTSPPSGNGPAATITATVSRRGRMPPVVTETYTVPRWFPAQAAPTLAERVVTPNAPLPVECGTPAPASGALFVHVSRRQIDPR